MFFFYNIAQIPLAEAMTFSKTSTIFSAVFAYLFVQEKLGFKGWLGVFVGFIGILFMTGFNPDNLENNMIPPGRNLRHDRKRLTAKLSEDDAKTWSLSKVIEEGPSGYSDVAQLKSGEFICIYECEIVERICDDRYVRVTKFDKNWLTEK